MSPYRIKSSPFTLGMFRSRVYRIFECTVLTSGLLAMIAMTVPHLRVETRDSLSVLLWCCLGFFALELAVKAWPTFNSKSFLKYIFSSAGLIDVLGVVPVPIALLAGIPANIAWLLAALWILKLATFTPGLSLLQRVIEREAKPLISVLVIFLIVLLLSSVALYLLEGAEQPRQFGSLPASLWWAVTTLTGTGYGDAIPQTFAGRVIAALVMICGLGVFGLWTGILATGFAAEYRRLSFIRNWELVTRVPFLRNLDPPAIIELTHMLRRVEVDERIVVVRRGRPGECMYFVASGEVEVMIEPQPVRLGPGSFFGEIALLGGGPRTATVITRVPTTLLSLEVADFRAFAANHPDIQQAIAAEAARRASKVTANDFQASTRLAKPAEIRSQATEN